jgi:Ca-activated chloride channel family protein
MDVLWPGFLFLLIIIPLLIAAYIWMLRRRRRFTVRYSSLSLVRAAQPRFSRWRRHLPFALFLLGLTSLVVALARPVAIVSVPTGQTTIILAIDVSRSMCATDIEPNRLEAAKAAALSFIESQKSSTQISIVAFAGFAEVTQPPTNDQDALQAAVVSLSSGRCTAIG